MHCCHSHYSNFPFQIPHNPFSSKFVPKVIIKNNSNSSIANLPKYILSLIRQKKPSSFSDITQNMVYFKYPNIPPLSKLGSCQNTNFPPITNFACERRIEVYMGFTKDRQKKQNGEFSNFSSEKRTLKKVTY